MALPYTLSFQELPDRGSVTGFDHFQVTGTGWGALLVVGCAAVFTGFSIGWLFAVALEAVAFALAVLLLQLLRFSVVIERTGLRLERSFLSVVYSRQSCPDIHRAEFIVNGTGDWGDEGSWPGPRYCEIAAPNWSDAFVGTPRDAEAVCQFLANQAARLGRSVE